MFNTGITSNTDIFINRNYALVTAFNSEHRADIDADATLITDIYFIGI